MKIKEAFPDVPVIDLRVGKKAEPAPEPVQAEVEEKPKSKRKKKADDEPLG